MKRLHRMIIKAYLGPLSVTFVIVLFILVMQFLWKYVDDLMGKGLEWYVLAELMTYATASFVPLALPLAILLSSIMTVGGLGENSELIPLRSAGLGLTRILSPLFFTVLLIAAGSFYFSNNLLPVANLKFRSLLWDVTEKKPALNLKPGIFYNGIDGFSIRVADKDSETGTLTDVLIYDHRKPFSGDRTVIRAQKGIMRRSLDGRYLVLELEDGRFYDEQQDDRRGRADLPMLRGHFDHYEVRFDLSGLGLKRTDEELFKDHYKMMTMGQLAVSEDSLLRRMDERRNEQVQHVVRGLQLYRERSYADTLGAAAGKDSVPPASVSDPGPLQARYDVALDQARSTLSYLQRGKEELRGRQEQVSRHRIEWHRKPMLAFTCLVFFLIGAPLGAIIRKGGMGLPVVFAIIFFLVFHIVSFSMEKLVIAGELEAWPGMWLATLLLLPVGLFLFWKASTDSPLLEADAYRRGWDRIQRIMRRSSNAHPSAV
ncbi:MAG: LptF/LptG family permease [Flavobacteriales bacterium]|jgi:lipopolysaccharide export system permease protein|nr:LptF/LptG family permease [Flavobacteriales bacterium]